MSSPGRPPRRALPIAMLTALAAVPAIGLAGTWQYAEANLPPPTTTTTTTLPPPPVGRLNTALLSLRRHPTPLAERVAEVDSAEAFMKRVEVLGNDVGEASCFRLVDDTDLVAELNAELPVIPASNQKLLVAAVALDVLGTDYRFRTELQSPPPTAGVIAGDVYVVGGGDPVLRTAEVPDPLRYPSFNTTRFEALVDRIVFLGITAIDGNIIGDGSRYDDEFRAPSWGSDITSIDAGPYDALLVNDGLIANGNYGLDPSRSAARIFYDMVVARGITITGSPANESRPVDAGFTTLALVESRLLTEVLVEMLHTSDNNTAEMLVKEIGYITAGQGTRVAGLQAIRATLAGWGVALDGVELHDGSGLSRDNRITCAALTAIMSSTPVSNELRDLLPVAGRDGTLARELLGTQAEGRLQAKTGTLTDVKALTGSLPSDSRVQVDFSLVLNGEGVDQPAEYEPVWKRVVALIDDYPIVIEPDLEPFTPR